MTKVSGTYEPPTLEGRAMRDLGQQLAQQRKVSAETVARLEARVSELEDVLWEMRPTARGHDCPFCFDWDGNTHDEDCILNSVKRDAESVCPDCHGTGTAGERPEDGAPLLCGCQSGRARG